MLINNVELEIKPWTNLREANLDRTNLREANLVGADLREANLVGADLRWADLRWADLRWADLREANLVGADLRWANLREANLVGADLREANLVGADLRWANLRGAIVTITMFDDRGYALACQYTNNTLYFLAGCRKFTFEQALSHWGSNSYPDKDRGDQYIYWVKFINDAFYSGKLLIKPE